MDERLERYAELVVRVGANVQPGQEVFLLQFPKGRSIFRGRVLDERVGGDVPQFRVLAFVPCGPEQMVPGGRSRGKGQGERAAVHRISAASCYQKAGVPEKFRARLYDTPHEFNAGMQTEAWEWLRKHV